MTSQQRMLYQQIHPAKLLTDFGTSFASTWLLWQAQYTAAAIIGLLPSIAITLWLTSFADLERLRASWFGNYLTAHMPAPIVASRIAGQVVVWGGAIAHVPWLIPLGYFAIILAWLNGLWDSAQAR
ncbi:MAG TPA: hypothetical protein VFN67_08350 [Polyangiales bacterium]|nr:hypothetical protein [Polyangiales bacterium]